MKKLWSLIGNILILALLVGGSIYTVQRFTLIDPQPAQELSIKLDQQSLEKAKVEAKEIIAEKVVVDEAPSSDPVQAQTIAVESKPVAITTSSLSFVQSDLKLTSLTRFDFDTYGCYPHFALSGDDFLCYLSAKGEPQLWLASLDEGFKRPLLTNQRIQFSWFNNHHILYAHSTADPFSTKSRPVFMMDIHSGQQVSLGDTSRETDLQGLMTNKVAFLNQQNIHIVNVDFATTLRAKPDITLNILGQSEESDNSADIPNPSTSNDHLYFRTFFKVSPNSQKIAILQTAYEKGTLTVMDVHSQQKTILAENIAAISRNSFTWSPDSSILAYTIIPTSTYIPELWTVQTTDLGFPQQLWTGKEPLTFDYLTWLPNRDELLFSHIPTGIPASMYSVYQAINVKTGEHTELFTNGIGLDISNNGTRITFNREYIDHKLDIGIWIATLSN